MSQVILDACPRIRYVRALYAELVRDYAHAQDRSQREAAFESAAALSHLITQVIAPLARQAQGELFAKEYERMASALQHLFGYSFEWADSSYPSDGGLQLIKDRLDEIAIAVSKGRCQRKAKCHECHGKECAA